MKKTWYWLVGIMVLSAISCKGQPDQKAPALESNAADKPAATAQVSATASEGTTKHITKTDFLKLVMDYEKNTETWAFAGDKPCLIDFYADWCAPCRITSPILEDLARQYAGQINIYKVDIEKERELAAVFGVQSIPTFLFCPMEGKPTISSGIASSPEATREMFIQQIEELLIKNSNPSAI
jgi:thioredoxin